MSWAGSVRSYAAFGLAIPGFVKTRLTLDEARARVKQRLQTREQRFLEVVERCIYANPGSPYLPLLDVAGCELGDIQALIKNDGLEPALGRLRDAGVYFTFEEFKGRQPVERGEANFSISPGDFDNPVARRHYLQPTGGTTGTATKIWMNLDYSAEVRPLDFLFHEAHGLLGVPMVTWRESQRPSTVVTFLGGFQFGAVSDKWFSPRRPRTRKEAVKFGFAKWLIMSSARFGGARLPSPEMVDPEDCLPVVRWVEEKLRSHETCLIRSGVSGGVRIAVAATEAGVDLTGATFMGGGEPPTPAKVDEITRSGARWIPRYTVAETGRAGLGCVQPVNGTDMHFAKDHLALIQHPRKVPGSETVVDALNFTTLSTNAPKVLLNVETDDFGVFEKRSCGCDLEELGLDYHLRDIFSFGKLTGEGVTLVGSDMVRILQEVLPARFGGSSLDYQLIEEEGDRGQTRMSLIVHPRIRIEDEGLVVEAVLQELRSSGGAAGMAGKIWSQSGTFRVKRIEPLVNWRGKQMPLHLSRKARVSE